jgi:hypothetical protein
MPFPYLNLKQHLDQVLSESGFVLPDYYIGNTDQDVAQIVAIAQATAFDIVELRMPVLRKSLAITLTSATEYDLPDDFLEFIPNTMYQHGRWDRADLATTDETWALLTSVTSVSTLPIRVKIIGTQLSILNPQASGTLNVDYYSNAPINIPFSTTFLSQFDADTNLWIMDARHFQLEVKWRFKKEKGMPDWQIDLQEAANRRNTVMGRISGNSSIVPGQGTVTGQPYTNLWVTN